MYGKIPGEENSKIWLVSLAERGRSATSPDAFEKELLKIATGVRDIEALTGQRMPGARSTIELMLDYCAESEQFGDRIIKAIRRELAGD
jgi:hypothetical protein